MMNKRNMIEIGYTNRRYSKFTPYEREKAQFKVLLFLYRKDTNIENREEFADWMDRQLKMIELDSN